MKFQSFFVILCLLIHQRNADEKLPLVINTWNFQSANDAAWKSIYTDAENAIDAIVKGCTACEVEQCDSTVGYGGSPDENGETTLDAMIMDGKTMNAGAVGALRNVKNAIHAARLVLEHTEHTLLVGDQATEFAIRMGMSHETLSTDQSRTKWLDWQKNKCQPNYWTNVTPDPAKHCGPYGPVNLSNKKEFQNRLSSNVSSDNHDTIGMIVISTRGHIVAGTSTNGLIHKIPGRVGDSPIVGSGGYASNHIGAAVATGDGDVMMRFLPSFLAVNLMEMGTEPEVAAELAIASIAKYHPQFFGAVIAVRKDGKYGAACNGMDQFTYLVHNKAEGSVTKYKKCL